MFYCVLYKGVLFWFACMGESDCKKKRVILCVTFLQLTELTDNIQTILEALRSSEVVEIKVF